MWLGDEIGILDAIMGSQTLKLLGRVGIIQLLSMNMNLWKKIGIDHHTGSDFEYLLSLSSDQEVFSSIKKSDIALKNRSLAPNAADLPCNHSTYRSENVSILKDKPSRIRLSNDFDLQFESCESEPLNYGLPCRSPAPYHLQTQGQTKQKAQSLRLDILLLQEEQSSLQSSLRKDIDFFKNLMQRHFQTLLHMVPHITAAATPSTSSSQTQTEISCSCEAHKKMIDSLTNQYWHLQQQLQQTQEENKELREQLEAASMQASDPLKKIQYGLLQERGESIKKLKMQQDLLQEENQQLTDILHERQRQMQQIEAAHEATLLELRRQIDQIREINYVCNQKVGLVMDEKYSIEDDLAALRSKYTSLERHYQNQRREANPSNICQDLTHSYAREKYNPEEKSVSSHHYSDKSQRLPPKNQQQPRLYTHLDCTSPVSYATVGRPQTTKADYISQLYQQDFGSLQSRLKEKEKWHKIGNQLPLSNYKKPTQNYIAQARIANGFSYEKALTNLTQIQRDVRKEINRSKEACR